MQYVQSVSVVSMSSHRGTSRTNQTSRQIASQSDIQISKSSETDEHHRLRDRTKLLPLRSPCQRQKGQRRVLLTAAIARSASEGTAKGIGSPVSCSRIDSPSGGIFANRRSTAVILSASWLKCIFGFRCINAPTNASHRCMLSRRNARRQRSRVRLPSLSELFLRTCLCTP